MQNPSKNKIQQYPAQKIAIYHTGALGDLLVSTAAIFECIEMFPQAQFTLIGSKLWKEIIHPKQWPRIEAILVIKDKNFYQQELWKSDSKQEKWSLEPFPYPNIVSYLKSFDATLDLRTESLRFAWRARLARVPFRIGGSKSIFSKLFFTHFNQEIRQNNIHERDRYLEILLSLDSTYIKERIEYWQEQGLPPLREPSESSVERNYILINPTASIREKAWPSEKFRQLALKLKESNQEVIIIGSPRESDWLKEVASEDFKMIQPQNIQELIEVVAKAKLLVTNTSSMQFIASSTKTPTLAIIGLANPKRWGPLGAWSHFIKGNDLRLNSNILQSHKKTSKVNEVLSYNSISVQNVLSAIPLNLDEK